MGNIERITNTSGELELFGASQHLIDSLDVNYANRGKKAAQLLVATLTETPYVYSEDEQEFAIPVSNRYLGAGDDEAETTDTVDTARLALAEFIDAKVPGTRRVRLGAYPTRYASMWRDLRPGFRTPDHGVKSFEEAFVEAARSQDVAISSPQQGERIIKAAPKHVVGLRFSDRRRYAPRFDIVQHKLVTTDGYILSAYSSNVGIFGDRIDYGLSDDVRERGGRAPGSRIASEIEERVVSLRTKHTDR